MVIPTPEEYEALRICGQASAKTPLRHKQIVVHSSTSKYSSTQAQGKQARDRRAEAVCSRCSSSGGCRQLSRRSLVCVRGREKKWPADMLAQNRCKVLGAFPGKPRSKAAWFQSRSSLMHQKLARHTVQQNAKCAASSSCACVRQTFCDRAMCCACDGFDYIKGL